MIPKLAGACWNLALLPVYLHVCMLGYVCTHTLQCQTCRKGKHRLRWEDSGGWKRGGLEQLSLCAGLCDECGSRCAIWCPSVMVDILWSSKAFGVVDTAQHHTVDLMFADSLSHCWYSKPWVVSEGKEESLRKSQNRDLHLVALCVPLSVWSLKCHLGIRHMKIKAEWNLKHRLICFYVLQNLQETPKHLKLVKFILHCCFPPVYISTKTSLTDFMTRAVPDQCTHCTGKKIYPAMSYPVISHRIHKKKKTVLLSQPCLLLRKHTAKPLQTRSEEQYKKKKKKKRLCVVPAL